MRNEETAAIERDHPGWAVWQSRAGVCWAATAREPVEGRPATLIEDSADELRAALWPRRSVPLAPGHGHGRTAPPHTGCRGRSSDTAPSGVGWG